MFHYRARSTSAFANYEIFVRMHCAISINFYAFLWMLNLNNLENEKNTVVPCQRTLNLKFKCLQYLLTAIDYAAFFGVLRCFQIISKPHCEKDLKINHFMSVFKLRLITKCKFCWRFLLLSLTEMKFNVSRSARFTFTSDQYFLC